ncbi:T-cell surface glycoprotein CD5 isoform X2 [Perca flavescens]|uniref:T-cell surface glycoprotein CD5 isoform X2 n=1 Tax=Perca flavescens TaxID=8167 RepID=UPI00106ECE07|nr:T-cell surface glycoprotein CD5-like isoform X2 [Perca flavescens]
MDLKTVVTLSTLLLITTGQTSPGQNGTGSVTNSTSPSTTSLLPSTSTAGPNSNPSRPLDALGLLTITWYRTCEGDVNLNLYHPSISSLPVCHGSGTNFQILLRNVCKNQKGCTDTPPLLKVQGHQKGYNITASGAEKSDCDTLRVQCTDVDVVQGQLQAYKVVTALLCCFLLLLILIRFTRPTVKALQKRFSERRQNRWVGPTQSHSVSYHRGKTAVKTNDAEKRVSYPALERLAVSDSREPSSNRNSGYNF